MSRTYKDKKWSLRYPEEAWDYGREAVEYEAYRTKWDYENNKIIVLDEVVTRTTYVYKPGVKTKKRKEDNSNVWHWMSTPSWWTRLIMNRPHRRKGKVWERKVLFEDLEETDPPGVSHKPHVYYW